MKPIAQFKIGSSYFFDGFEDYIKKDYDEICIMDSFIAREKGNVLNLKINGKDVFFYRNMPKEGFIRDTLSSNVSMRAGKFLIPEFNEFIGFTIDDLLILEDAFYKLDDKHQYERLIYQFYLENRDFTLTEQQRLAAYEEYKRERPEKYKLND